MTINEFIEKLKEMNIDGTETLVVHAFGGIGGCGQAVDKVSVGFDWDIGKIILHTKNQLELYRPKCRGCGKTLDKNVKRLADGCVCNSARGINHGLVPTRLCTCKICDPNETGSARDE